MSNNKAEAVFTSNSTLSVNNKHLMEIMTIKYIIECRVWEWRRDYVMSSLRPRPILVSKLTCEWGLNISGFYVYIKDVLCLRVLCRGHCAELMSHWQFIGTERSIIGKRCLSVVREMEDGRGILCINLNIFPTKLV